MPADDSRASEPWENPLLFSNFGRDDRDPGARRMSDVVSLPLGLAIRQVKSGDEALFDRVADDVFDVAVDRQRLAAYLASPGHLMLVALLDGAVVAQVAAVIHRHPDKPTELYIDEVGVTPALQRQGIARRMVAEMFTLGKALGCEEAWVGTEPDNVAARALYESRGATGEPFVMYEYEL